MQGNPSYDKYVVPILRYFKREIDYAQLLSELPDTDDETGNPAIDELLDTIEHEPLKDWLLGANDRNYRQYKLHQQELLAEITGIPKTKLWFVLSETDEQ